MKKLVFAGFAAAILAGCNSNETYVLDAKCERVASGTKTFVVKCPITEKLAEIQAKEPEYLFIGDTKYVDEIPLYAADPEHVYVEVNPNASNGNQPIYRVMIKMPNIETGAYAVMAFEENK